MRALLRNLRHFRRLERRNRSGGPIRPDLLARGFLSQRARLYPLDRFDLGWFLNDWEIETRLSQVNDSFAIGILTSKVHFHLFTAAWAAPRIPLPPLVGLVWNGTFLRLGHLASLEAALEAHGSLYVKPVAGAGGRNVVRAETVEAVLATREVSIVEGAVRQHAYAAAIHSGSVNTIRILTCREDGSTPFVAGAAHRFGVARSMPVDNFKRGGLSALVDLETGILSTARSNPGLHAADRHPIHPETQARIEGVAVPFWSEAIDLVLRASAAIPGLRFVGWDICVAEDGPCLIEGNARTPNPNLIQAHVPLLLDPRVRRFFRDCGVLSSRRFEQLNAASRRCPH